MKTSFGEMEILLKDAGKLKVEHLKFDSEGRPHKHQEFESFFVLKGSGKVYVGENIHLVKAGSLVVIPPSTSHWMKPDENVVMEGLLWYHNEALSLICG